MDIVLLISWALPIFVLAYLVALAAFVSSIRKNRSNYWQSIGNPSLWEPNGQIAILKRVLLPRAMPHEVAQSYRAWVIWIRVLAILSGLSVAAVFLMIWLGAFEGLTHAT